MDTIAAFMTMAVGILTCVLVCVNAPMGDRSERIKKELWMTVEKCLDEFWSRNI